ncbi:MAG: RNA-binding S4 domain-containing protein [bacterium]
MNRTLDSQPSAQAAMRLDKWLKLARIYKNREAAASDCALGRIKVNEQVAKASKEVKAGDVIVVRRGHRYRTLEIKQIPVRGLSAKDAKEIYHEHTPEIPEDTREMMKLISAFERQLPEPEKGRPTKKNRREIERWRGKA